MKGQGRGRHAQRYRDLARGQPIRPLGHEQTKHGQPGLVGKRGQSGQSILRFHDSRIIELYTPKQGALSHISTLRPMWERSGRS